MMLLKMVKRPSASRGKAFEDIGIKLTPSINHVSKRIGHCVGNLHGFGGLETLGNRMSQISNQLLISSSSF